MTLPSFVSSHWLELGYTEEQAHACYTNPAALAALREPQGLPRVRFQSPFQRIEVFDHSVVLNGTIQLDGRESRHHNELMVAVPLSVLPHPRRVLILGGGLGMGARQALEFPEVEHVQVVEVDADVVRLASQSRTLRRINEKSLAHPRVQVHVQDAFEFIAACDERYDLIVFDCDLTATRQSAELEVSSLVEFFQGITSRLEPGGGFSTRIPIDDEYLEIVDAVRPGMVGSDLERASALVREVWPEAILCEFLSVYCGRELLVWNFPGARPTRQRILATGSHTYRRVVTVLF